MEQGGKTMDDIFKFSDVNGDGFMDLDEFKTIMKTLFLKNKQVSEDIKYSNK